MAKIARNRKIDVFVTEGEDTHFNREAFGTVFLIATMCFLDSPIPVLKETNRILAKNGKIVLGLVLKESPWGQFYLQKKAEGHRFYKYAEFYSFNEVKRLLFKTGFTIGEINSTLFQKPGDVSVIEEARDGCYPEAGFTIITAYKNKTA